MPIQIEFLNFFNPKSILELGVGYYSTKLFLENCNYLVSIESDSDEWFNMTEELYKEYKNWQHLKISGLDNVKSFLDKGMYYDLIFVDGDEWRAEETNHSFKYADTIIGHDTQHYFRDKYQKPDDFYQIDFTNFQVSYGHSAGYSDVPWTTLFTKRKDVYDHFFNLEMLLYEKYKFPYLYEECPNPNFNNK
jgi:hypothetical protein